jgi:hypothetical protein
MPDWDDDHDPHPHAKVPHADASLARAMLAQTAAGNCPCGVQPTACPAHREPEEASHE